MKMKIQARDTGERDLAFAVDFRALFSEARTGFTEKWILNPNNVKKKLSEI